MSCILTGIIKCWYFRVDNQNADDLLSVDQHFSSKWFEKSSRMLENTSRTAISVLNNLLSASMIQPSH